MSQPHPRTVRLGEIAHARSGDKGSDANIGVIAYTPAGYAHIRDALTADRVREFLAPMGLSAVERYELPNLGALNFVVRGILAGGGSRSPRIDPQGKTLGQALLEMHIPAPADFHEMRPGPMVTPAASLSPAAAEAVLYSRRGPAAVLTLNRPAKRNALNTAILDGLAAGLERARAEPGVRAVVLTGAGPAFCAGMDLDEVAAETVGGAESAAGKLLSLLRVMPAHPLPLVAAVNGHAVAGGAGLMSGCDVVIVARGARLGYPEVRRGLVAAMVMSFLVRQVGDRAARRLLLGGELIDADEAVRLGLATKAADPADLWTRTDAAVAALAEGGPEALASTKRLLGELGTGTLADDLSMARETHLAARLSDEAREGMAAFLEKRKPRWSPEGGSRE
jgi:methylglutaconyl-CoA hydratase